MPQITVWCLPQNLGERKLRQLHKAIVAAAVSVKELELTGEGDMLTLFPPDMMRYGAGTEIMVQVSELWDRPGRTPQVRNRLATALGQAVKAMFPKAVVAARVDPLFRPARDGFWTSRAAMAPKLRRNDPLFKLNPEEFFSKQRLMDLGVSSGVAARVNNGVRDLCQQNQSYPFGQRVSPIDTMRGFLEEFPTRQAFTRVPNMGHGCAGVMAKALKAAGLPFEL